ncbi:hypothetical protein HER32_17675 [Hymenobacter sp. BT18]|uniref:hypothetical protein n=1 Tax=Hymenobacter sp. BT18 TaxID=2835648 RepID=UPI00143E9092|nr:hypothetical protein [Hymenobacter sp. BT18]QIX62902.1 hypothetical protein HER32_17675 [Hymenobacter sp. BT18]
MKLDFLQRLPFGAGRVTHRIVSDAAAGPERTAAEAMLKRVLADLPEVLVAAVIGLSSGQPLASYTTSRDANVTKICGYNAEVVRQTKQALHALRLPNEQIDDILITLSGQLHLLRPLPGGRQLLYLAVDSRDTNLALARAVIRACAGE